MRNKRRIITVISVLLVLSITCIVYLTSFKLNAFNERFHSKEFKKYNVYGEFPDKNIDEINSELLLYLNGKKEDYSKELFNQAEINHLKDVKAVVGRVNIFYYSMLIISILLIVILFLLNRKAFQRNLSIILFFSGLLTLLFTIALLVLVWLNFDNVFRVFHRIFFPQGGWLFRSSDNIIRLYPSEFFYDTAKRIFFSILLYANILILAAILISFYKKWLISQH